MTNINEVAAQLPLFLVPIASRGKGWITHNDRVIVVEFQKGEVYISGGHICSWPGSHGSGMEVDNIAETIVWGDECFNEDADNADDAYEKSFVVTDPHLLKAEETQLLYDPATAVKYFAGAFSPEIATKIANMLAAGCLRRPPSLLTRIVEARAKMPSFQERILPRYQS